MDRPLNILSIQNEAISHPGYVGERIYRRGGVIEDVMPQHGDPIPTSHAPYDGLLVLGGTMDAFDDEKNPQFRPLIRLLQGFHGAEKPILGICLGAQLAARTFDKRVYRHHELEIGFTEIEITAAGSATPVLSGLARRQWVMEWHQDTFDLPDGAELIATGERCPNQAFRIGRHVYAFQFHFEASKPMLRSWIRAGLASVEKNHPDFPARMEREFQRHMAGQAVFARHVSDRWLDLVKERAGLPSLSKAG
jgi:GMP synthase-like glutamine amidotransferase